MPQFPSDTSASGIWPLKKQKRAVQGDNWPSATYRISRSLRFNSADSTYLTRTPAVQGNRKTWTWSGWVKRSNLGSDQTLFEVFNGNNDNQTFNIAWFSSDCISIGAYNVFWLQTTPIYRDPSAWYHVVCAVDTTQATANNRIRVYVNGAEVTTFSTRNNPSQNADLSINQAATHYIGSRNAGSLWLNGYLAEVQFIDGQQLTPSSFGETDPDTGVWEPKAYSGSYGANGFYLPFNDNSSALTLGRNRVPYASDPYWQNTVMLLNGNGTSGAQNSTFLDSSANAFAMTRSGNATQGTFSPYGSSWSNYFDGSGDSLTLSGGGVSGTGAFTVEFWMCPGLNSTQQLIYGDATNGALYIYFFSDNLLYVSNFNVANQFTSIAVNRGAWTHVVIVRNSGGTYSVFLNGSRVATQSGNTTNYAAMSAVRVGGEAAGRFYLGHLSNLRVSTNAALYDPTQTTITVPTTPLTAITNTSLLTCQSNRFIDNSSNNFTVTRNGDVSVQRFSPFVPTAPYSAAAVGGSAYFDGSGDWVTTPNVSAFDLSSSSVDFTIEAWVYNTGAGTYRGIFGARANAQLQGWCLYIHQNNTLYMGSVIVGNAYADRQLNTTVIPSNTWTHVALVKTSSGYRGYVNGVAGSLVALTGGLQYQPSQPVIVGALGSQGEWPFLGHIADARIVKGSAVYTSNFTPATAPLSAIANTSLLLNFTNAGIVDSALRNDIDTAGGAQISTAQSRFGNGSMQFNGSNSLLAVPYGDTVNFQTANFTVEMWVNPSTTNHQSACLFTQEHVSANNTPISICLFLNGGDFEAVGNGIGYGVYGGFTNGGEWVFVKHAVATLPINTWTHLALVRSGNVFTVYVNGVAVDSTTSETSCSLGTTQYFIGRRWDAYGSYPFFNGFIDDFRLTRGAARYTGTFAVPDREMAYNVIDVGTNQWTPINFSVAAGVGNDSLVDTPTSYGIDTGVGGEVRGNYATLNPLTTNAGTYTQGNLRYVGNSNWRRSSGTTVVSTGKWYWEVTVGNAPNPTRSINSAWNVFGFGVLPLTVGTTSNPINGLTDVLVYGDNGYVNNFGTTSGDLGAVSSGDVLSIAVDLDANSYTFRKNGSQVATGTIGGTAGRALVPVVVSYNGDYGVMDCNFGQRPFAIPAPAGFRALCTQNLPLPVIGATAATQAGNFFAPITYTGTGSTRTVTGLGFTPDLVWIKSRTNPASGIFNSLMDSVRGSTSGFFNVLYSNTADSENNPAGSPNPGTTAGGVTAFTNGGFTLTPGSSDSQLNNNGTPYVAWNWRANGAGSSNTAGSITSTVSANTTAGFSVVTYTGTSANATVGHGLGVAPSMIIVKSRSAGSTDWRVFASALNDNSKWLALNTTAGATTESGYWNTGVSSTVFGLGNYSYINASGSTYVAYCFAAVPGYSAFGSYTGNGSTDGPFVFCGFRPAFVLLKSSSSGATDWVILDNRRDPSNVANDILRPNLNNAELVDTYSNTDFLANGFKLRGPGSFGFNISGTTYIFAAFAEAPFKFALAR